LAVVVAIQFRALSGRTERWGPSLEGIARHSYITGQLPNQPSNLERWIQDPHSVHPDSLMQELGLTDAESWAIAAYPYTLN
jgi:cytochrome c